MGEHELLIRHAQEWASSRSRPLDADLLDEALGLRLHHDELTAQEWPAGTAERLLLVTWPAYGSAPQPQQLRETLDTFWRFLRATGRMASSSAAPADLRKEGKRAAGRMQDAYDDPANHSQHRALADLGRSIGIELEGAADVDDLNDRLGAITEAWNSLPQDERFRLMPDPAPKGTTGAQLTEQFREMTAPGGLRPLRPRSSPQPISRRRTLPSSGTACAWRTGSATGARRPRRVCCGRPSRARPTSSSTCGPGTATSRTSVHPSGARRSPGLPRSTRSGLTWR